jgi:hypothetical protein
VNSFMMRCFYFRLSREGIPMSRVSFASVFSRTAIIFFGLLISVALQAGTFTNATTALTAPASSSTGNYTVSFKTAASGVHRLQEKKNSGSWVNVKTYTTPGNGSATSYPTITRNVSLIGRTTATYSYRVNFGGNYSVAAGYSNIKVTVVSITPGIPVSINTPDNDNDGAFTASWGTASGTVTSYKLEQQVNSGAWSEIYSGTGLSHALTGLVDSTYNYRVRACNSSGCSGYRTAGSTTLVLHAPGIPSGITITEL